MQEIVGIDVGATGIKGARVNINTGELTSERMKYKTPSKATPEQVVELVGKLLKDLDWEGKPFGCGFPSIIQNQRSYAANNISKKWIDFPIQEYFEEHLYKQVYLLNDADAAGLAEMKFGAGKDRSGKVIMITLGTGLGSGFFIDGHLIPNIELGSLPYKKSIIEHYVANKPREEKNLSWEEWGKELNKVLNYFEKAFFPDLMIIGGGVSKHFANYSKYINLTFSEIVVAEMKNLAGIVGPAMYAYENLNKLNAWD